MAPLCAASTRGVLPDGHAVGKYQSAASIRVVRTTVFVIGVLLILAGLVWVAQGLNLPFAPRSFMTADRTWILIGAITAAAGALVAGWARREKRPMP